MISLVPGWPVHSGIQRTSGSYPIACSSQLRSSSVTITLRQVPPYCPISAYGSTTRGLAGRRSSTGGRSPASTCSASDGASAPFGAPSPPAPFCAGLVSKNEQPASVVVAARPPPVSSSDRPLTAVDLKRSPTHGCGTY